MDERKIRVLIDTRVVLDLALQRGDFQNSALEIFKLANREKITAYISPQSIPTLYFYVRKAVKNEKSARHIISTILAPLHILDMTAKDCLWALQSPSSDYEDAILAETANRKNLDAIITRDQKGFKKSTLPIFTPEEFLKKWR